ncbi:unnamed protein product [Prorocentrum cordatum]|uniref:Uncharacterized protein n=1 Tax=Prorocentrum cordatum TaxID=2364126 RepID=A0ABN9XQW7_9DINO|nr:unnamed protein product [Polarella glacialis]
MASPMPSGSRGCSAAAAASDGREQWQVYTIPGRKRCVSIIFRRSAADPRNPRGPTVFYVCLPFFPRTVERKHTFLHIVEEVEVRWRRERLPRSRSAPAALDADRPEPAQQEAQRSKSQRRRQQRIAGKKRTRAR